MKPAIRGSEDTMSAFGRRKTALDKGLPPTLLAVLAVGGLLFGVPPASAIDNGPTQTGNICMQTVFGTPVTNANKLNCTANDIRLSRAISVSPSSCVRGDRFDLTATFETVVTANARYDAGFFFRIDGGTNARGDGTGATGECSLSALTPPPAPNPPALELDGDTCGDLNAGTYSVTFTIPDVLCQDTNNDRKLNLPNCTSWHSNQGTVCDISNPFAPGDAVDFKPDTKSKCVCDDTFQVPVTVEDATLTVTKDASPTQVPEPGGTVTFTVTVKNDASVESVNMDTIIDDKFGNLGTIGACGAGQPPPTCTPASATTSCPSLIGVTLGPGATRSCQFNAFVSGNFRDRHTDEVEVCALQPSNNNAKICDTDTADVDITDVFTAPTLQKTAQSTANCRVDATYQVVVSNNSTVDPLTVNSLSDDKFGDITTVHPASAGPPAVEEVVSTGCEKGGTIAASGNYSCSFVGRITSCDITHTDTVTGNVTDNDGTTSTPFDDATVTVTTTP